MKSLFELFLTNYIPILEACFPYITYGPQTCFFLKKNKHITCNDSDPLEYNCFLGNKNIGDGELT